MTLMNPLTAAQKTVSSVSNSPEAETAAAPDPERYLELLDNANMFEHIETMARERELRTLNSHVMEITHDTRMSVIRNIENTSECESIRRFFINIEKFDHSRWRKISEAWLYMLYKLMKAGK